MSDLNLETMDIEALKAKAAEFGIPAKGNKQQLKSTIRKHLASLPAPEVETTEAAGVNNSVEQTEAAEVSATPKRYRITPKNSVSVQLGGVYVVPGGGMTVDEGHPLIHNFDYYLETKEVTE